MDIYKSLERPPYLLGIPQIQIGLLFSFFLGLIIMGTVAGLVMQVSGWYDLLCLGLVIALYVILRRASAQKHPSYLLSYLSYHFFQPTNITHDELQSIETQTKYLEELNTALYQRR